MDSTLHRHCWLLGSSIIATKMEKLGGSGVNSSFLSLCTGDEGHLYLQKRKNSHKQSVLFSLFFHIHIYFLFYWFSSPPIISME